MALINWDQEITFNHPDVYGNSGGYNRNNRNNLHELCLNKLLISSFPFQTGESILLVGAGFGWIAELFLEQGLGPVCAVDTSAWIQSQKHIHSVIDIHNLNVTEQQDQLTIKQLLGVSENDKIDWCITEDFFTGLTDQECVNIASALRSIGKNVIHYITPPPKQNNMTDVLAQRNWKTGQEWKSLLSPDKILMVRSTEIL